MVEKVARSPESQRAITRVEFVALFRGVIERIKTGNQTPNDMEVLDSALRIIQRDGNSVRRMGTLARDNFDEGMLWGSILGNRHGLL